MPPISYTTHAYGHYHHHAFDASDWSTLFVSFALLLDTQGLCVSTWRRKKSSRAEAPPFKAFGHTPALMDSMLLFGPQALIFRVPQPRKTRPRYICNPCEYAHCHSHCPDYIRPGPSPLCEEATIRGVGLPASSAISMARLRYSFEDAFDEADEGEDGACNTTRRQLRRGRPSSPALRTPWSICGSSSKTRSRTPADDYDGPHHEPCKSNQFNFGRPREPSVWSKSSSFNDQTVKKERNSTSITMPSPRSCRPLCAAPRSS
ncbi:hypothetical protein B0H10DRAFT_2439930 [Mycena sp. CBHHK59/15]|nr:hypothetical protein B0H10DRAFT_2439930 [Mycena sp. CBHHK59/15]